MKISIAMAAYNGDKFIAEQIDSILNQTLQIHELIISIDDSVDNTEAIALEYEKKDSRVKVLKNELPGVVSNFSNSIKHCTGDIIFLSDQDDIWENRKVETIKKCFEDHSVDAVAHDYSLVDENLSLIEPSGFQLRGGATSSFVGNLYRLRYIGCCLAFRTKFVDLILPIPTKKRSHDWWIGSVISLVGNFKVIPDNLIRHRMHENNVTPKKKPSFKYMIYIRFLIFRKSILAALRYKVRVF